MEIVRNVRSLVVVDTVSPAPAFDDFADTTKDSGITGKWTFEKSLVMAPVTMLPANPEDGEMVYYYGTVGEKFLIIYKDLGEYGVSGWYKVSDDSLVQ